MSNYEPGTDELRRRVAARLRGRMLFWAHVAIFLLVAYFGVGPGWGGFNYMGWGSSWLVLLPWLAVIVYQGVRTFRVWDRWVDRAMQREMAQGGLPPEKAKRSTVKPYTARLSDDGELEYEDEAEPQIASARKQKRGN